MNAAVPQHLDALAKGNQTRLGIVALKAEIKAGLPLGVALADDRARPARLSALLAAQVRWGSYRAMKACQACGIDERLRVRDMTPRQRSAIVAYLADGRPHLPDYQSVGQPVGRDEARVVAELLKAPMTRAELTAAFISAAIDLDVVLARLVTRSAVRVRSVDGFDLYDVGPRGA